MVHIKPHKIHIRVTFSCNITFVTLELSEFCFTLPSYQRWFYLYLSVWLLLTISRTFHFQALGQWGTAHFDNSDQQQKFLRLMGGFKKGNQPTTTGGLGRPNMALGRDEQQNLQQKLLGQFQQAQNRRMDFSNKGSGLGFVAPSNKKFAIDVNASRSMKFDDWSFVWLYCVRYFNHFTCHMPYEFMVVSVWLAKKPSVWQCRAVGFLHGKCGSTFIQALDSLSKHCF